MPAISKTLIKHMRMRSICLAILGAFITLSLSGASSKAYACGSVDPSLGAPPSKLLHQLGEDSAPILAKGDAYARAMEACYDSPLGPLELAPFIKQADSIAANMKAVRALAEEKVRDNEVEFEALLSSDLWGDIESLRVAGAYASAWGQLAGAVREISADDKRKAMQRALAAMRALSFEFKHPVLVQRAMYGLASAHIEAGNVTLAKDTLERLRQSLRREGAADFKAAVEGFYARISASDYQPPVSLFADAANTTPQISVQQSDDALALARQAIREARPADEIVAILKPALSGDKTRITQALDLLARDQLLIEAMDYEPGQSLRVMRKAFIAGQYGQINMAWRGIKPFHSYLPRGLKRQVDYQLGVALLNLGELKRAIVHLTAAQQALPKGHANALRIEKLIVLAHLSFDAEPDAARLALAQKYQTLPPPIQREAGDKIAAPPLDHLLALRARVVLARSAAQNQDWAAADKTLTGIGPEMAGYQLFLGMRVRLLAEALKALKVEGARADAAPDPKLKATARGAALLYRLWLQAACPPGCVTGDRLAVHRNAIEIAFIGDLAGSEFGRAWGGFVEEGGDTRPLIARAIGFLVTKQDADRLMALLEADDENRAAFILAHWKDYLTSLGKTKNMVRHDTWLGQALRDLQGRPQAVLLEALIIHDLDADQPVRALAHAEQLAAQFPRRPSSWFLRAASLQANQRSIEAARALSALAQRTPADDPVGMGARLGLAALFVELERGAQACAMRTKIFARPTATANWAAAQKAFPILTDWQNRVQSACS